ncbi:unnamed protein product [Hyaloperonospora brassicae]|uniref:GRIP domain-containing protein n=1 Tax=Hyaloperonospora brassicae TaxID=162125 RepID=A0AAV0V0G7_HYABA|nr:unnamed protein product [Hyaloperonospora brassicae]
MLKKKKDQKLEHMRELGRDRLTKGLHFLRTAAAANATAAALDSRSRSSDATPTVPTAAVAEAEGAPSSTARRRLTYDELLTLSMKLTRQNKVLSAQCEKTQRQAAAAQEERPDPLPTVASVDLLDLSPVAATASQRVGVSTADGEQRRSEAVDARETSGAEREAELEAAAGLLARVEQEKAELAERLQRAETAASAMAAELERDESKDLRAALATQQAALKAAEMANERLQEQVQALQQAPDSGDVYDAEVKEKVAVALEAQRMELEMTRAESARLREQVTELLAVPLSADATEAEVMEKVAIAIDTQALELEATKAENARLQEQVEASRQTMVALTSEAQDSDAQDVTDSLRAEVDRLRGLLEAKDSKSKDLEQEVAALRDCAQKVQEEAKCSSIAVDTDLMQELERVKLETVEREHEKEALQGKLQVAEERLAKIDSESEATQSLLGALKDDTSRLADQVAQLEQKQAASDEKIVALTEAKCDLEKQQQVALEAKAAIETQLEEERVYWTSKLENLITASDAADIKNEALDAQLREKEKQVATMAASQASLTSELKELQDLVSSMRKDLSTAAEDLKTQSTKAEADKRRRVQSEKKVAELKKRLDEMREKHHESFEMLRQEKEAELERVATERRALIKMKKELSREKDKLQARCQALELDLEVRRKHEEELETVVRDKTLEVGNVSAELAETKKSLSDRMALATRLQTENMDMASKLAEQVVLIEGALRDAASSKAAQREMEAQVQVARGDMQRMEQSEAKSRQDLDVVQRDMAKREESFQAEREEAKKALQTAVQKERQTYKRELQRLEAESKHKSKLALQAVLEKETEVARLSARLHELEEDVRSGGADNRKILEFAQLQAKREAEAREQAAQMHALSEQLEGAHRELQELREGKRRHTEELTAMLQNQRRDGVNMEYLKNVVVQYMSFRPGSSEQARLVPVLSTLLQFTAADVKGVKHASCRGSGWTSWGSSDAGLDYKPVVVNAGHHYPTASNPSITQDGGERRPSSSRKTSALASHGSLPSPSFPPPFRAPSFFLPDGDADERADPSAESADF